MKLTFQLNDNCQLSFSPNVTQVFQYSEPLPELGHPYLRYK